jgi:hypothetical protein
MPKPRLTKEEREQKKREQRAREMCQRAHPYENEKGERMVCAICVFQFEGIERGNQ